MKKYKIYDLSINISPREDFSRLGGILKSNLLVLKAMAIVFISYLSKNYKMINPINNYGQKIYDLAKKIFYINRSITGNGVRKTLYIIKDILPELRIYEIKSKKKVFDWQIPLEWNIKNAYIKKDNKIILNFKDNNLHIVGYSHSINKSLKLDELKKKNSCSKKNSRRNSLCSLIL